MGFESLDQQKVSDMIDSRPKVATGIDWALAPEWLTIEEACFLSGHDWSEMLAIIDEGGVDLNLEGLIEKRSLRGFRVLGGGLALG